MAKKPANPYPRPTPAQEPLVAKLAERALGPGPLKPDATPSLIDEADPDFKPLRRELFPVLPGVELKERALGTVISMLSPEQIARVFGSQKQAVETGFTMQRSGTVLNALQIEACRFENAELAEAVVAAMPRMRIFFQYSRWCVSLIPAQRLDQMLMTFTEKWNPGKDVLTWMLLEDHTAWSPELSRRILDGIINAGTQPRHLIFTWGGNGVANNLHPTVIEEALVTLKPWAKTQANAKRWSTKLKARRKSLTGE
ncbi:MAG: hypothetical protein QM783_13610 [Phycisphaerales bacterium]